MTPRHPPPGPVANDEEGDPLPRPEPKSDLADLIALAEWARQKEFIVSGPIRVGKIAIHGFQDVRLMRRLGLGTDRPRAAEPEPSIGEMVGVDEYTPGQD